MPIRNPYQKQCSPRHHNNKQTPQAIIDGKENKTGESRTSKKRSWIGQQQHQPSLRNAPQFSLPSLLSPSWSTTGKGSTSIISDPNPQIPSNNPIILPLKQLPTMECDQSELIVDEADPFACDIDWDEAERTFLDKMHMHDRTVKNNDRKYKSTLGPRVQHQPTIVQPSINNQSNRSSSSKSECQRASMGGLRTDGGTTTNHHTACTPVGEAPCSSTGATKNSTASTEATWWSASDALLQESLPPPLRFSPDMVKPIDDELRTSLVQNASLNQPLQNGWHLYGHQKRAILRGLVMRRMILALDMGLGTYVKGRGKRYDYSIFDLVTLDCLTKDYLCALSRSITMVLIFCCLMWRLGRKNAYWVRLGSGLLSHDPPIESYCNFSRVSATRMESNGHRGQRPPCNGSVLEKTQTIASLGA